MVVSTPLLVVAGDAAGEEPSTAALQSLGVDEQVEPRLEVFIEEAKRSGAADAFIVELLKASGWSERRIYGAFTIYYGKLLGRPVPMRGNRFEYARDGFLYLLTFISLGCWATGAGHLFYLLIDRWFPSPLDAGWWADSFRESVSLELATLIVAFPIFLIVSAFIARQLTGRPELADSGVRKWLTYSALVIAAMVLLGDAILFLQSFLHGDLTPRFILKTGVLFTIVGLILGYYLQTVRGDPVSALRDRTFVGAASAVVVAALVFGFFDIGSPAHERALAFDDRRVDDLVTIANGMSSGDRSAELTLRDPRTRKPYERSEPVHGKYRLCATFDVADVAPAHPIFGHASGRQCFVLDVSVRY